MKSLFSYSRFNVFLVLLSSLFAATVQAQETGGEPARAQLQNFTQGMQTFSADFQQRVIGTDGSIEDESSGQVWLAQPHYFRWVYGGEFPEQVVADGQQIWIYDESLEQVTVKPQSNYAVNSPLTLLTDISRIDEQFQVREAGDMDGLLLLELRSLDTESEFERVLLGLQDNELKLMTMEDAFGLRTEIRFINLLRNPDLEPSLFVFIPPDGVDITGTLGSEEFD